MRAALTKAGKNAYTLAEAKQIIENYKAEYQQYLGEVPDYIMENDEAGFYSRLGFANIDENVLAVEYKFVYTSGGGFAQRSFTVPMTEETIADLIRILERKLTAKAFVKRIKICISSAGKLRKTNFTAISANKYNPNAHGNATAAVMNREKRIRLRTSFPCPAADEAETTGTLAAATP